MAQTAMAGSAGANAPAAQAKASNNNSAVKAQLQMQNAQQSNAAAAGNNGAVTGRYSSAQPMDVASTKTNGAVVSNGMPAVAENASLKHDSGLATEWSAEEQSILDEALNK